MRLKQRLRRLETAEPAEIAPPLAVIRVRTAHARQPLAEACHAQGIEWPSDRPYIMLPERFESPEAWSAWVQRGEAAQAAREEATP